MTEFEEFYINASEEKWTLRNKAIQKYGFAILSEDVIDRLKKYAPILEVGAGTGYWAYEFQKRGIDYIATDLKISENSYFKFDEKNSKHWTNVENLSAEEAIEKYSNRTLLMCWPCYAESWAYNTVCQFKGDYVIYVGEGYEGCTADDQFHYYMDEKFELIEELELFQWKGLHDRVFVYRRK